MRRAFGRVRAHAGLWGVVGVSTAVVVFAAGAVWPVAAGIENRALRQTLDGARYQQRDVTVTQRPPDQAHLLELVELPSAVEMRDEVLAGLPVSVRSVAEEAWGYQRTRLSAAEPVSGASLVGEGVSGEPDGWAPAVSLYHQTDFGEDVEVVSGRLPDNSASAEVLEVILEASVAEALGLGVGGEYRMLPGVLGVEPGAARSSAGLPVRLVGAFRARDPDAAVWEPVPELLRTTVVRLPDAAGSRVVRADLVTDEGGFALLFERGLNRWFRPESVGRLRIDAERVDAAWAETAARDLIASEDAYGGRRVLTGLRDLLVKFADAAAVARAQATLVVSGMLASLAGVLIVAVRMAMRRRRGELAVLQARGASLPQVARQVMVESVWVVVPAATLASVACWNMVESAGPVSVSRLLAALAVLLLLAVAGLGEARAARPPVSTGAASRGAAAAPARTTAEVAVVVLAALGALLLRQRGLTTAGVDPYLSTVPALFAVAAGVVALRLYTWPMRMLTLLMRRQRGATTFLGLASGRATAPGGALVPLVLMLAIAAGATAGTINTAADATRDTAAIQQLGAHVRVTDAAPDNLLRSALWPPAADLTDADSEVAAVQGVEVVATMGSSGTLLSEETTIQNVDVISVDTAAYQRILAALDSSVRLPPPVTSAGPTTDPLPMLAPEHLSDRAKLSVRVGAERRSVVSVGDVAGLPGLERRGTWILVPRQALASPGPADELLISGPGTDLERLRTAVEGAVDGGGDLTVTTLAQVRDKIQNTGFNSGLTRLLRIGIIGAAVCAALAVCVMLATRARDPGRTLTVLHAMGMSSGQARGLMLVELAPATILATAVGTSVGAGTPLLLQNALSLFTSDSTLDLRPDSSTTALLAATIALVLLIGLALETVEVRRHTLRSTA